jgi:predicted PurR-regulated permease PerM
VVESQARNAAAAVAARTLGFLSGIPGVLLQLGVALFSLFYFLRDGDELIAAVKRLAPDKRVERKILNGNASKLMKITG